MRSVASTRFLTAGALAVFALAAPALSQTTDQAAEPSAEPQAAQPAPAPETAEDADISAASVLATVGDREITLGEVISLRRDLPEQYQYLPDEILSQGLLDQLIEQTLLEKAARDAGMDERLDVALSIRNQIRAVLADAWLRVELEKRMTEERLLALYDTQYATTEPEDEVRAAHILVETEEKAKDLLAQLDNGADFAALAAEHGTDGTASRGGELGWFVKGDMVPQFSDAAFATEPGQIAGPVESPFGWHLIKVFERREKPVPTFEEVREELAGEAVQAAQAEIMEELRAGTTVTVAEPPVPAAAIRADDLIAPLPENGAN
ncbi:peptidylprolyl isomerase [Limibaculum sp. M0105]|uniref:Parvulin-like PPIase n=1 Tax=Thermohalobaculum xanthum TaxID=2753746 RepID=A0A8J7M599_9RHOB|nr:peptidylprolyl isomerase [Thermohalobaculum xanthum]MBK0398609.1 peptidylprolyl isomerase [Thermohalobaculum xanthum]